MLEFVFVASKIIQKKESESGSIRVTELPCQIDYLRFVDYSFNWRYSFIKFLSDWFLILGIFCYQGSFLRSNRELPCLHCKFIEMGEMACYEETCPQCGRVPSCRKKEADKYKESLEILRKEVKKFLNTS